MATEAKPQTKVKPLEPSDCSHLIAEIEVLCDALAHYQIRARLNAFRVGVEVMDKQKYQIWKSCPPAALEVLKTKLAKEIEAFNPVSAPPPPVDVSKSNDDFF